MTAGLFSELVVTGFARRKMRLFLTSLGVVVGTSAVVLMVGLGIGLQANAEATFDGPGVATRIQVYSTAGEGDAGQSPESVILGRDPQVLDEDAVRHLASLPDVSRVVPSSSVPVSKVSFGHAIAQVSVVAVADGDVADLGCSLAQGRWPARAKEAVIGAGVPTAFSGAGGRGAKGSSKTPSGLVGHVITLRSTSATEASKMGRTTRVRIVGVLKPSDESVDRSVYVPLAVADRLSGGGESGGRRYSEAAVQVSSPDRVPVLTQRIMNLGYMAFSQREIVEQSGKVFRLIQLGLGGIASIALFVACIGIANTMTMAIYERTREIGIMKAIGASPRQIRTMFLLESATIGAGSGVIGVVLSWTLAGLVNVIVRNSTSFTEGAFRIPLWLAVLAVLLAASVGTAAGMVPAVRAARLSPKTAIRRA